MLLAKVLVACLTLYLLSVCVYLWPFGSGRVHAPRDNKGNDCGPQILER